MKVIYVCVIMLDVSVENYIWMVNPCYLLRSSTCFGRHLIFLRKGIIMYSKDIK